MKTEDRDDLIPLLKEEIKIGKTMAHDLAMMEFKSDVARLNDISIQKEDFRKYLSHYISNEIKAYLEINNYYKSLKEAFKFELLPLLDKSISNKKRNELEVDFIASMFVATAFHQGSYELSDEERIEVLEDAKNIQKIVLETELQYLKTESLKEWLRKIESKHNEKKYNCLEDWFIDDQYAKAIDISISIGVIRKDSEKLIYAGDYTEIKGIIHLLKIWIDRGYMRNIPKGKGVNNRSRFIRHLNDAFSLSDNKKFKSVHLSQYLGPEKFNPENPEYSEYSYRFPKQ